MTYIKKITMRGFKSFGDRTVSINLSPGFTCIVGPNGAGKSNVIDALCFCLGRMSKKTMRAKSLSDLIFAGTKTLKPANKSKVTIVFDNSTGEFPVDSDEFSISRTVKQKGGSRYKIQGKTETREKMLNLLAQANVDPDGSNQFVLQGKIVELTHMNIVERRKFIETLIGLEKYDDMIESTMKELEKADRDLGKFEAIFKEVSSQLKKYEKEKNDALRWKDLDEQIKQYNAGLIAVKINKLKLEEEELENEIDQLGIVIQDLEQTQNRQKEKIEQENLIMANLEERIKEKELERGEIEQRLSELRSDLSAKETELKHAKETIQKLEERKEKLLSMQEPLEDDQTYENLINDNNEKLEETRQEIEDTTQMVDETDASINEKDSEIAKFESEKNEILSSISQHKQEISSLESEVKVLLNNIKKAEKSLKKNETELKSLKDEEESIEDAITNTNAEMESIESKIQEIKNEIESDQQKQKELEDSISDAQDEKSEVEKKLGDIKAKISSMQAEINLYNDQIIDLNTKNENLQQEYERLSGGKEIQERLKELKANETESKKELKKLKEELQTLNQEQKNKEHEKNTLELKRRSLENEITDYRTRLSGLETELNINKKDLKNSSREQTTLELAKNTLEKEISDLNKKLETAQKKENSTQNRLESLTEERQRLLEQIETADEEYENSKMEVNGILQVLSILSQDIGGSVEEIKSDIQVASESSLKNSISTFKAYIEDLVDIIKPVEEIVHLEGVDIKESVPPIIETMKLFTDNIDDSLREIVVNVREANDIAVQQSTSNFDNLINDFIDIIENVNISLKQLTLSRSGELHRQVEEIAEEIQNYTNISAESTNEISKYSTQIEGKNAELATITRNLNELNKKIKDLEEKVERGENEQSEKTESLETARNNLKEIETTEKEIADFSTEYWKQNKTLNAQIEEQTEIVNGFQEDLRSLGDIQRLVENMEENEEEIENIKENITNKENEIESTEKSTSTVKDEIKECQEKIEDLKSKRVEFTEHRKELDAEIEEQNKLLRATSEKLKGLETVQRIIDEIENLKNEIDDTNEKIDENKAQIEVIDAEIEQLQTQVDEKESFIDDLKKEKAEFKNRLKELRTVLSDLNSQLQDLQNRTNDLTQMQERAVEIQNIEDEIDEQDVFIGEVDVEIQELNEDIARQDEMRDEKVGEITGLTKEREDSWEKQKLLRDELNDITAELSSQQANLQTGKNKQITITERIESLFEESKEYGNLPPVPPDETESSLISKMEGAKKDKKALEPVNLKAIEYYEEVRDRFDEIDMRRQTLQRERKAILDSIDRIELEKTRTFMKAYHEINRQFSKIFQKLSPGGSAKMILERPDKPFEGGIQIEARPRGKKISSLEILSGGEKTLVALSFIFAVQTQFPAPFYILDEIDAALDGPNVHRVSMAIKEFSGQAQFLVISHREENIMNSEMIYGVSQTDGLTSIFSVDLDEAKDRVEA